VNKNSIKTNRFCSVADFWTLLKKSLVAKLWRPQNQLTASEKLGDLMKSDFHMEALTIFSQVKAYDKCLKLCAEHEKTRKRSSASNFSYLRPTPSRYYPSAATKCYGRVNKEDQTWRKHFVFRRRGTCTKMRERERKGGRELFSLSLFAWTWWEKRDGGLRGELRRPRRFPAVLRSRSAGRR